MGVIWFVTPAYRRFALSAVCFDQRKHVIDTLAEAGIEARCVVIADDENLDLARERGFDVIRRDNNYLGRKFNDGIQHAGKAGAEWIVPIGSDSWIDPAYFLGLHTGFVRTSRTYCAVTGDRLAELSVRDGKGAGPYVFHRSLLVSSGFRPADDLLRKNIDGSTVRGIVRSTGRTIPWSPSFDRHPYQYIGFRGTPTLTPYHRLTARWGVRERADPWAILARHYPPELVERVRGVMSEAVAA